MPAANRGEGDGLFKSSKMLFGPQTRAGVCYWRIVYIHTAPGESSRLTQLQTSCDITATEYHPSGILDTVCPDRQQNAASSLPLAKRAHLAGKHTCACAMIPRHDNSGTRDMLSRVYFHKDQVYASRRTPHLPHAGASLCSDRLPSHITSSSLRASHTETGLTSCLSGRLSVSGGRGHASGMTGFLRVFACARAKVCGFV